MSDSVNCRYCGSVNVDHHHDHDDRVTEAIPDGTPVYKCQSCLGLFSVEEERLMNAAAE